MCFARNETLQKYVRTNKVRKADKPWQHGLNSSSFWNISHAGETLQGNLVTPEVSHLHTRNTRRRRREQSANRAALLCSHATQHTSKKKSDTTHAESEKTPTSHYSSERPENTSSNSAHGNQAFSVVIIMSQRDIKLALCRDYFSFTWFNTPLFESWMSNVFLVSVGLHSLHRQTQ